MRSSLRTRKWFYAVLTILFLFSLNQNGTFDPIFNLNPDTGDYTYDELNDNVFPRANNLREQHDTRENCAARQNVVFLKTHKTASSTAAAIIERYGFRRNLTFAVSNVALKFYHSSIFKRTMVKESPGPAIGWKREDGYNMLTNHARFNKVEMDAVVHNAIYVTILRNPINQLESAFGYFGLGSAMELPKENQLLEFMKDPHRYFSKVRKGYWQFAKNNQLFDLGLDHSFHDDVNAVREYVRRLDRDFHLVMISEYFDESLILLRKLLCWDTWDILYVSVAVRSASHRTKMDDDLRHSIAEWNKADMELYQHFNASLWRKIKEYGPEFDSDLNAFRNELRLTLEQCTDPAMKNTRDKREDKSVLRSDAPQYCEELLMGDVEFTRINQQRMWDRGILLPNPKRVIS